MTTQQLTKAFYTARDEIAYNGRTIRLMTLGYDARRALYELSNHMMKVTLDIPLKKPGGQWDGIEWLPGHHEGIAIFYK